MAEGERARRRERERERERAVRRRPGGPDRRRRPGAGEAEHLPLETANLVLFGVALAVIILGYVVLAQGSITLAPILLVLGYCVLVPVAIVYRPRRRPEPVAGGEPAGGGEGPGSRANSSAG